MKHTVAGLVGALLAFSIMYYVILILTTIIWNLTIPNYFSGPYLSIWQIALLYCLLALFRYNWIGALNKYFKAAQSNDNTN